MQAFSMQAMSAGVARTGTIPLPICTASISFVTVHSRFSCLPTNSCIVLFRLSFIKIL